MKLSKVVKPIAVHCICNTASLNIFEIDSDTAIVGINDIETEKVSIETLEDPDWEAKGLEDSYNTGFRFGDIIYFLDEFIKI